MNPWACAKGGECESIVRPHSAPNPGPNCFADFPMTLPSSSQSSVVCTGRELCLYQSVWLSVQLFRWLVYEGCWSPHLTAPVAELTFTVRVCSYSQVPDQKTEAYRGKHLSERPRYKFSRQLPALLRVCALSLRCLVVVKGWEPWSVGQECTRP